MTSNSQSGSVGSYFNNDINIDILWHHSVSGVNTAWLMNGISKASVASLPSLAGWDLEGVNDFSGDGEADILWRNYATGENRVWFMNDTSVSTSVNLASLSDLNWRIEGTSDFNADGKTDILWRNYKTGANTVWLMNGTYRMSGVSMQALSDVNWHIEGTGDFNADGNTDIVWRNYKTGANTVWFMNGTSHLGSRSVQAWSDVNWQIEGTGDFNNDGRTDILWRNYSTGANTAWFMNGTSRINEVALATVKDTSWKPLVQASITPSQPDLIVQNQYVPSSATAGDTITIGSYTRNIGKASAGYSYVGYWLSDDATLNTSTDRYLGYNYVASLNAGAYEYDTFDFVYESAWGTGTKYIFFQADEYNYATESNETNNTSYRTINITQPVQPSITVTAPNGGNTLQMGQSYNITWNDNFSDNVRIWLYKGNEYLQTIVDSTESDGSYTWTLPTNLTPGNDYKIAVGIPSSTVTTYDFSDIDFSIVVPSQPDLVVQSQYAPSSATVGDTVSISAYTKNNGQASAGSSYIRYWLSDDAILNTSTDRYLGEDYVSPLSAGSSEYDTFDFTYNSNWGTGTKYIFFQTDIYNEVTESNESNNFVYQTISVTAPSVTVTAPNGGNTLQMGQSYNITWSDNFSDNVRIELYKGSSLVQTISSSINSNGSFTWTPSTALVAGNDYRIKISSASNSNVSDYSDTYFTLAAPSQPDLVIQNQSAPNTVFAGDTVTISASVVNQGTGSAAGSNLKYYLSNDTTLDANDIYLDYDSISSLATNGSGFGSHSFTYNSTWGTGTKYILFKADADSTITESNESNNVAIRAISVAAPSVTVTAPNGGNTLQMGQSYNITWSDNFSDNVRIELYKGSSLIQTISSSTSSNGSFTWTPPTALVAGNDYRIKISSASNSSVSDYSDTYFTLAAPSQPDLVIQSQLAPSSVVAGDLVTISASVVNQGTGSAAGNNLKYYLSNDTTLDVNDIYLGYDFISSLAANGSGFGSHSFTYSSTWGTGTKYILFQADADSSVAESNESNNAAYRSINVAAPSVTVTAPNGGNTLQIGQSYNITWSDNFSDNVGIELYKGSSLIQTISSSTPSNGSFTWTPSTSLTAGSDYRIKITNTSNSSVTDFSNSYFTINQLDNGFNIQIDYRFDTQGWFTSEKKAALEAAVNIWESIILDEFNNKPVGTITPYVRNPETGGYVGQQHSDGSWTYTLDQEIDDLLIFVGARELGGSTLGTAGSSGNFTNEIRYTGDDFEPWIGSMAFDITTNWFFDSSPLTSTDIPPEASDFISVAVHEIGHILGITYNSNGTRSSFNRHVSGGFFYGSNAVAQNGGNPIPLEPSLSHIQDGYKYGNWGENALDPTITSGKRKLPTILDIAMMDDIGYDVDYSRAYRNA